MLQFYTQWIEGASLKAFIIGGLVLFQQINRTDKCSILTTSILQTAGFSAASDAAKFLITGFVVFKVDDLGRRPLLIGGLSGITIPLLLLPV